MGCLGVSRMGEMDGQAHPPKAVCKVPCAMCDFINAAVAAEREKYAAQVAHLKSNLDALGAHAEVVRAADVKAAVAEEKERCADTAFNYMDHWIAREIAKAIRARGERGDG